MENLPVYIAITLVAATAFTVFVFLKAARFSKAAFGIIITWLILQSFIALTGFYTQTTTLPPRIMLLVAPPMLFIIFLFATKKGRRFIDNLDIKFLTLLHAIRIPVELVLFWLFLYKAVPQLMTFEGRNPDIISGLTAPLVFYFAFIRKTGGRNLLLFWNLGCVVLLMNIIRIATLSTPYPFQQMGFEQPNIAVLYFPFAWLPGCIVPLVLLSHLSSIRQLLLSRQKSVAPGFVLAEAAKM